MSQRKDLPQGRRVELFEAEQARWDFDCWDYDWDEYRPFESVGGDHLAGLAEACQRRTSWRHAALFSLACATHMRLGRDSPLRRVPRDVLKIIARYVPCAVVLLGGGVSVVGLQADCWEVSLSAKSERFESSVV